MAREVTGRRSSRMMASDLRVAQTVKLRGTEPDSQRLTLSASENIGSDARRLD